MMTADEYVYMLDLKSLDDTQNAMLAPGARVKNGIATRDRCAHRGWVRCVDEHHPSGDLVCYLTTKGLRAITRESKRRALRAIRKQTGGGQGQ